MKFTANRATLADALAWAAQAVPANPSMPIMSNIRVTAHAGGDGGTVTLAAFDYEASARTTTPAGVFTDGDVLVPAAVLSRIVKGASGDKVEFVVDDTQAILNCDGWEWTMPVSDVAEYPALPVMEDPCWQIEAGAVEEAVERARYATSKDDSLPMLTALLMEYDGKDVTWVATDRYRLAVSRMPVTQHYQHEPFTALVPGRMMKGFLSGATGPVDVSFSNPGGGQPTMIGLSYNGRTATSRLLTGDYPKWRGIVPAVADAKVVVTVGTKELGVALSNAALALEDKPGKPAVVWFSITPGQIRISGGDEFAFGGTVPAEVEGDDLMVKLRLPYVLDTINHMGTDTVRLHMTSDSKPVLLLPAVDHAGPADQEHVIMPMRDTR